MKCQLQSVALSTEPFGAAKAYTTCMTHQWAFGDLAAHEDGLCPIGQIEKARDQALTAIAAALAAVE